jgi:hypothetical protein
MDRIPAHRHFWRYFLGWSYETKAPDVAGETITRTAWIYPRALRECSICHERQTARIRWPRKPYQRKMTMEV